LLTHTAGISPDALDQRNEPLGRAEFLNKFFAMKLASKPGGNHDYANPGYMMLAAIVEQQAKQSYESFLYSHLLKPAGLEFTGYTRPQWIEKTLAHGYYYHLGRAEWTDWGTTPDHWKGHQISWYDIGKGDLHSNTQDLYKWHQALQSNNILSAAMRKLIETPHVAESESGQSYYGYGWSIVNSEDRGKIVAHNGSNGVFFSDFIRYIDKDVVVIVQSNTALSGRDGIAWQIGDMIFDPNHTARPVSQSEYELVNEYIQTHSPDTIDELMAKIQESSDRALNNRWIFNNIGRIQYQAKNCDWAITLLKRNTTLFADDGRMFKTLGEAYEACGQPLEAQKAFDQAQQR
jgi:CubicO group peptidase (beta-lactamase class C family)